MRLGLSAGLAGPDHHLEDVVIVACQHGEVLGISNHNLLQFDKGHCHLFAVFSYATIDEREDLISRRCPVCGLPPQIACDLPAQGSTLVVEKSSSSLAVRTVITAPSAAAAAGASTADGIAEDSLIVVMTVSHRMAQRH